MTVLIPFSKFYTSFSFFACWQKVGCEMEENKDSITWCCSTGTQYLQPTAMQQQVYVSVWERNKETKGGRESCNTQNGNNIKCERKTPTRQKQKQRHKSRSGNAFQSAGVPAGRCLMFNSVKTSLSHLDKLNCKIKYNSRDENMRERLWRDAIIMRNKYVFPCFQEPTHLWSSSSDTGEN